MRKHRVNFDTFDESTQWVIIFEYFNWVSKTSIPPSYELLINIKRNHQFCLSTLQKATHYLQPCTIFAPQSFINLQTNFPFPDVVIFQLGITIDKTKCLVSILHKYLLTIFLQNRHNFWKIDYTNLTLPIWCIFYNLHFSVFDKCRKVHHILREWRAIFFAHL